MSNPLRSKTGEFQPATGVKVYPSSTMPVRGLLSQIPPESAAASKGSSVAASGGSRPAQSSSRGIVLRL